MLPMRKVCREDREEKKIIVPQKKMHKRFFQEMKLFKRKRRGQKILLKTIVKRFSENEYSVIEEQCSSSTEDFESSQLLKKIFALCLVTTAKFSEKDSPQSGVSLLTPAQSGVYKAVMKEGKK